jgi:hypothetical protein
MFNVFNLNTITQRNDQLSGAPYVTSGTSAAGTANKATGSQTVQETQAPRIVRFSGRISF